MFLLACTFAVSAASSSGDYRARDAETRNRLQGQAPESAALQAWRSYVYWALYRPDVNTFIEHHTPAPLATIRNCGLARTLITSEAHSAVHRAEFVADTAVALTLLESLRVDHAAAHLQTELHALHQAARRNRQDAQRLWRETCSARMHF